MDKPEYEAKIRELEGQPNPFAAFHGRDALLVTTLLALGRILIESPLGSLVLESSSFESAPSLVSALGRLSDGATSFTSEPDEAVLKANLRRVSELGWFAARRVAEAFPNLEPNNDEDDDGA